MQAKKSHAEVSQFVEVILANACTQRSPACARRGYLYVLVNQQFLGLPCKKKGQERSCELVT